MSNVTPQADDAPLTPLQQAARERIVFFTKELAREKCYIRTGMELEFFVEKEKRRGIPISIMQLNDKKALKDIKDLLQQHSEIAPYVEELKVERPARAAVPENPQDENKSLQYEILVGEHNVLNKRHPAAAENFRRFSPVNIARAVHILKTGALREALNASTSLSTGHAALMPNFDAGPYPEHDRLRNATSGLHIHVSLYDEEGNNRFIQDESLRDDCIASMLETQRMAGLMAIPTEKSYARLGANKSTPEAMMATDYEDKNGSIRIIHLGSLDGETSLNLEDRLAGADADPYVAMAATLAGIYDAVCLKNRRRTEAPCGLPGRWTDMVEIFRNHENQLKPLIGDELYHRIHQHYGRDGAARS